MVTVKGFCNVTCLHDLSYCGSSKYQGTKTKLNVHTFREEDRQGAYDDQGSQDRDRTTSCMENQRMDRQGRGKRIGLLGLKQVYE